MRTFSRVKHNMNSYDEFQMLGNVINGPNCKSQPSLLVISKEIQLYTKYPRLQLTPFEAPTQQLREDLQDNLLI